ncbi:MAG TPA: tyrosine--tRNA ligase [Ktedonobacteraceae bacterium]
MGTTEQALPDGFARTTEQILAPEEFTRLLESGRQLRIKYGIDVTAPYLHIGHAVNLWLLRQLQDRGHRVMLLIGDFTTRIGDPTGRDLLRPVLPREEITRNAQTLIAQAGMVLRVDDPNLLEIRRNSEWYAHMSAEELLHLFSQVTYTRLIARDMFQARIQQGRDIYMHELLYPVLQGHDSAQLCSDLTIIGSDQLFNEMLGRFYQERCGQNPQVIITTKITPGLDGRAKQSKSLDNYIGLGHTPREKFGRTMTLPDALTLTYLEIYTDVPLADLVRLRAEPEDNPMHTKLFLAHEIVRRYHGAEVAGQEQEWFLHTFSRRQIPADIPDLPLAEGETSALEIVKRFFGARKSTSELRRLFQQGGVSCNGCKIKQPEEPIKVHAGDEWRVGKRLWFRVQIARVP